MLSLVVDERHGWIGTLSNISAWDELSEKLS